MWHIRLTTLLLVSKPSLGFVILPLTRVLVRGLSSIIRARDIELPLDKIEFSYARSSGPGGQNVNKVNSKAEMRFHVMTADWIPFEVRQRLSEYQANRINKLGELVVTSQENRMQTQNRQDCIEKIQEMIAQAYVEPTVRTIREGLTEKGKAIRLDMKKKRGAVKTSRNNGKSFDYDD